MKKYCHKCLYSIQGLSCWICVNRYVMKYRKVRYGENTKNGVYIYGNQDCVGDESYEYNKKKLSDNQKGKFLKLKKNKKSLLKFGYQGIFPSWSIK